MKIEINRIAMPFPRSLSFGDTRYRCGERYNIVHGAYYYHFHISPRRKQ